MKFPLFALALCVSVGLNATAALPGAPGTTRELQPPREYTEKTPAYLYYKKITVTRDGDNTYLFDVTLQAPMPEQPPEGLGLRYIIYGEFTEQATRGSSVPTTYSSTVVSFEKKGGGGSLETKKYDIQIEKKKYPVGVQDFKVTPGGFSFALQSPYFAKNIPTVFQLDAASLFSANPAARGASPEEKSTDQTVNIDPSKPGVTVDKPLPPRVAGATPPGMPSAAPTPTPIPDPPGQVTWKPDPRFVNPMMGSRMSNEEVPIGYLYLKKVVLNRESDDLKFTVTLFEPLPETIPADRGVRYSFLFQFAEPEQAQAGLSRRKADAPIRTFTTLEIQFPPGAKNFEPARGELRIGKQVMDLKVIGFERTTDGFVATIASPIFEMAIPTSVAFRTDRLLPNQANHWPNNPSQAHDSGGSVIVPPPGDAPGPLPSLNSLIKP